MVLYGPQHRSLSDAEALGEQLYVENIAGAGGNIINHRVPRGEASN
jgi:hypothetical protein